MRCLGITQTGNFSTIVYRSYGSIAIGGCHSGGQRPRERHNQYQMISTEHFFSRFFSREKIFPDPGITPCTVRNPWDNFVSLNNVHSERKSGESPKKPSPFPRPCPTTIPAPFGHWLMPVNVFRSLWKWPGFRRLSRKMPFRNSVYEDTPFLYEIDPGQLPDWQSGPYLCPDSP